MRHRHSLLIFLFLALFFMTIASAASTSPSSPQSYCKCTCGTNSMIIPLDPDDPKAPSCTDCNRQYCLSYGLAICKEVKEEDVFTTCFQRDSVKDEAVVVIFIVATVGLLIWAVVSPWVMRWFDPQSRGTYDPIPSRWNYAYTPARRTRPATYLSHLSLFLCSFFGIARTGYCTIITPGQRGAVVSC